MNKNLLGTFFAANILNFGLGFFAHLTKWYVVIFLFFAINFLLYFLLKFSNTSTTVTK